MSSASRAGPRGGKGAAKAAANAESGNKSQKSDTKADHTPKGSELNPKTQPTAEQMRMAQYFENRTEDPDLKNKIKQVMDATRKSEDEVSTALHDCDNDLDRAVNMLLEGDGQDEWVTSSKKKKNRNAGGAVSSGRGEKGGADGAGANNRDRSEPGESGGDRERSRTRGGGAGGPPRMRGRGSSDSRGWRGRENKENEKNLQQQMQDESGGAPRRGGPGRMANGPGRSGRGGRGGRPGPRTFQSREKGGGPGFSRPIETWNPQGDNDANEAATNGPDCGGENWDDFPSPEDWDNEEYTGSLADTKVFTSSSNTGVSKPTQGAEQQRKEMGGGGGDLSSAATSLPMLSSNSLETAASMLPKSLTSVGIPTAQSGQTLTPAQSQYLSQLATENLKAAVGVGTSNGTKDPPSSYVSAVNSVGYQTSGPTSYPTSSPASVYTATTVSYAASTYGSAVQSSAPSYGGTLKGAPVTMVSQQQNAQSRPKTQRPRVPPPSKIPQSAVEMPGDATSNSNIGFLDVQFGALDFSSDSTSFEFTAGNNNPPGSESGSKFQTSSASETNASLDLSSLAKAQSQQAAVSQAAPVSGLEGYASSVPQQQQQVVTGSSGASPQSLSASQQQHAKDISQQQSHALSAAISHTHPQKMGGGESMTFPSQEHKSPAPQQSGQSATSSVSQSYSTQPRAGTTSNQSGGTMDLSGSKPDTASSSAPTSAYPSQQGGGSGGSSYHSSYQKPYQGSSTYSGSASSGYSSQQSGGNVGGSSTSSGSQYPQAAQQSQNYASQSYTSSGQTFPSQQSSYSQSGAYSQSSAAGGYQATSAYPSSATQYQPSNAQYQQPQQQQQQQVYSGGTSSSYAPSGSAGSQYQNSYGSNGPVTTSTSLHGSSSSAKMGSAMSQSATKDSQYETQNTTTGSGLGSGASASSGAPSSSLGLVSSAGNASTKVTSSSSSAAGVPPTVLGQHQYIMGQAGTMPYFNMQQPTAIYGFDDYQHQLMQSRGVTMQTSGFYDLSSLTVGRDSGMTSVAYPVSDGRFARTDNNSSPVPSTLSQQNPTQAHQQPMINPGTLPPGYAYFYGTNVVPAGGFQYGTPTLYQLPTATNAHGATNSSQYAKPATGYSGYSSGYDALSGQGATDYSKGGGGYQGTQGGGQGGKGNVVGTSGTSASAATAQSGSDLSSNMYSKAHVALGKVNSYDKQGFHSGTPPPFSLPGAQTNQMSAATAAGFAPLFIPPLAHQLHQPLHQMEFRGQGRRSDSNSGTGQRSQPSSQQSKSGVKSQYNTSYWAQN